jgi:hypothetical protein
MNYVVNMESKSRFGGINIGKDGPRGRGPSLGEKPAINPSSDSSRTQPDFIHGRVGGLADLSNKAGGMRFRSELTRRRT